MKQSISIVIPAFNSSISLPELIKQLDCVLKDIASEFEIILVDDASIDDTWKVIKSLCKSHPKVRAIQLMKNSGQANATICGLGHAIYDIIITLDDDLQHLPDQIPVLLEALLENSHIDCVYGIFNEKHHRFYRNTGSWLINYINRMAFKLPQRTKASGFRVMRRNLVREITCRETANPSISVLILGCTQNVMSIPITHKPRFSGKSNYTFVKQFRLAFDNICNATMFPLRLVSAMGISLCIITFFMTLYYLIRFFSGNIAIQGWTTIVLLVIFFSGMTMLSLGIIGEYLVRVLREVSHTPPYLIRKKININKESSINSKD